MITSMTKRGILSLPKWTRVSCSDFLSAYSSGKFFCMMLFSVTLPTHSCFSRRILKHKRPRYYYMYDMACSYKENREECKFYLTAHVLGVIKMTVRHSGHLLPKFHKALISNKIVKEDIFRSITTINHINLPRSID